MQGGRSMSLEKTQYLTQLFSFYGPLLTAMQQRYFEDYYFNDLSLAEISENADVSRQAVYDNLKRTTRLLEDYEAKLNLNRNFLAIEQLSQQALSTIDKKNYTEAKDTIQKIRQIIEEN